MNHLNTASEGIYYEIVNIEPSSNTKMSTVDEALYLNQIIKLDDDLNEQQFNSKHFNDITSRLNSLNSILHDQKVVATCSYSDDAAIAPASTTNQNNKQLSRNSSTFSSKSHFSMRSSMTKGTGGGGNCYGTSAGAGSVSLSIATGHIKTSNIISKEQEIINQQNINNNPIDRYSIESTSNVSIYSLNLNYCNIKDPIIIRGAGNITIFGVCNKFNEQFPTQLNAKLAPEEFRDTIKQINNVLSKELANSFRWLVFGSIFCCCTLGISLLPVIFMNKKAKLSINKFLDIENQRLYLRLGLKWKLTKMKCNSNSLTEYVLMIEILPTILLYQPD